MSGERLSSKDELVSVEDAFTTFRNTGFELAGARSKHDHARRRLSQELTERIGFEVSLRGVPLTRTFFQESQEAGQSRMTSVRVGSVLDDEAPKERYYEGVVIHSLSRDEQTVNVTNQDMENFRGYFSIPLSTIVSLEVTEPLEP